jgi:hypothetical protein
MVGFGIDLAGYSTGKTSLAAAEFDGRAVKATVLRGSSLSIPRHGNCCFNQAIDDDVRTLGRCLETGNVAVDIPIDLQGLPLPLNPSKIWALTRRPIDRKLRAMPPFADRIGAPVARFAAIMREGYFDDCLGRSLFETYPAEIWRRLKVKAGNYKGANGKQGCASLCVALCIEPPSASEHDIDAIICAIAAAAPAEDICVDSDFENIEGAMPRGFRILKVRGFDKIFLATENFDEWMDAREKRR